MRTDLSRRSGGDRPPPSGVAFRRAREGHGLPVAGRASVRTPVMPGGA